MMKALRICRLRTFAFVAFTSTLFYFGCKKLDLNSDHRKPDHTLNPSNFFESKASVTPITKKVIDFLMLRNETKKYI